MSRDDDEFESLEYLEDKYRRDKKRNRNLIAKDLRDNKGPYGMKVVSPKKEKYKRERMRVNSIDEYDEDN